MGKRSPVLLVGSFGSRMLRVRELNKTINISREDKEGFTIAEYVADCLGKLGIELTENRDTGTIILGKTGSSNERWWNELSVPKSMDLKVVQVDDSRHGYKKRFVCYSLSALREVIHLIRQAKFTTKLRRSRRENLEKLSTWGLASAILLIQAVFREVYVCGERRDDMRWCCEWMMGEADEEGHLPDRFLVDLPLRLVKGCSMMVITHGAFAVRIDATKALKLMRVGEVFRKDFKVYVLRAGVGKAKGARSARVKVAPGRYVRIRDYSAVITTKVLYPQLKHRPSGYSRSRKVVYLD